jgi:phytoene synthase
MNDAVPDRKTELAGHYAHCERQLREADRDLWLACLFAPQAARPHLHAIYAFACEIAGVREKTSQPLLGEMRLRWWYDALEASAGEDGGGARAHPVADALLDTIAARDIPREEVVELIEAHVFDLYAEPMASLDDLETYCARTVAAPMRWSAAIIDSEGAREQAEATSRAGLAAGLTRILRFLPKQMALGQSFAPRDLAARHGAREEDFANGVASPGVRAALAELRSRAREHYDAARKAIPGERASQAALLPAALVPLYLDRMERKDYDPFRGVVEAPPWRRQWRLWRAARAGGL